MLNNMNQNKNHVFTREKKLKLNAILLLVDLMKRCLSCYKITYNIDNIHFPNTFSISEA